MQREELEEVGERGERPRWGEKMGRGRGRKGGGGGEKGEGVDWEKDREVGGEGGAWGGHLGFLKTPFFWKEDKVPESLGRKRGRGSISNKREEKENQLQIQKERK